MMQEKKFVRDELNIEGARIIFRNFAGAASEFNKAGDRNISIMLEEEHAIPLTAIGWNIKQLSSRDEAEPQRYHLPVTISYKLFPPEVWLVTSSRKTLLTEDTVGILDSAEIVDADVVIRPYNWEVNGKSGVKAYLKTAYITIREDRFASKYSSVPSNVSGD